MFDECVIMAGGSGTRLWPLSNSRRPKQFLPISPDGASRTFFSAALERALALTAGAPSRAPGRVLIIAGKAHVPHIVSACAAFSAAARGRMLLMVEPEARNTAPAIACGTLFGELEGRGPGRAVMVLTSDHIIEPLEVFCRDAEAAAALARRGKLAVFGIRPSRPETGYGYIEAGAPLPESALPGDSLPFGEAGAFAVNSFREKPGRPQAEEYIASGRFYWNSGMFAFSSSFMLEEFRRHAPEVLSPFEKLAAPGPSACRFEQGLKILDNWPGFAEAYGETQAISFDYAIAEKCAAAALIRAHFSWTDVGSWDEYAALIKAADSEAYSAGAANCFVDSAIPVALCGVEDLVVVIRPGGSGAPLALIAKKGETQRIREIVEQIKAAGRGELL
jgi:mannose-1-phosphate guanylyltransferase/mannose-1-phosphate guanylyltransferase/mannose-6-phosphate isomerase